jgi:hypothetical protein
MKHSMKKKKRKRVSTSKVTKGSIAVDEKALRAQIAKLLDGAEAHADWRKAFADMPAELMGAKAEGAPHTAWQLLEHLRIAEWDILEFSRDPKHVSPQFPDGYWPPTPAPPSADAWEKSAKAFGRDLAEMKKLVSDSKTNLFERIAHGDGQTILREALLTADHNAYHLGQLILLRKMLGAWSD